MKVYSPNRTKALLIILLLSVNMGLFAQDSLQLVIGTIRNSTNNESISFAFVTNEMLQTKVIADEQGSYIISINRGDLLKITAIGYQDGFYIINDSSTFISNFPIRLIPRIYELKEFTITPYKTVMQFKHAFVQLKLPEENHEFDLIHVIIANPNIQESNQFDQILGAVSHPISFFYNTFSHAGKMTKKYNRLIAKDNVNTTIFKRLNFDFVASIVPISTKEDLEDFIGFCQFDLSFILNATDYELIAAVQKKHLEYIHTKLTLP